MAYAEQLPCGPLWDKCQANLAAQRRCNNKNRIHTAQGKEK
jgi:hypothetical protein